MGLRQDDYLHRAESFGTGRQSARQVIVIQRGGFFLAAGYRRCNPDWQLGIAGRVVRRPSDNPVFERGIDRMAGVALSGMAEQKGEMTLSLGTGLQNFGNRMGNDQESARFNTAEEVEKTCFGASADFVSRGKTWQVEG